MRSSHLHFGKHKAYQRDPEHIAKRSISEGNNLTSPFGAYRASVPTQPHSSLSLSVFLSLFPARWRSLPSNPDVVGNKNTPAHHTCQSRHFLGGGSAVSVPCLTRSLLSSFFSLYPSRRKELLHSRCEQ